MNRKEKQLNDFKKLGTIYDCINFLEKEGFEPDDGIPLSRYELIEWEGSEISVYYSRRGVRFYRLDPVRAKLAYAMTLKETWIYLWLFFKDYDLLKKYFEFKKTGGKIYGK